MPMAFIHAHKTLNYIFDILLLTLTSICNPMLCAQLHPYPQFETLLISVIMKCHKKYFDGARFNNVAQNRLDGTEPQHGCWDYFPFSIMFTMDITGTQK